MRDVGNGFFNSEKRLFDEGDENCIFDVDGIRIGVQICFDLWFPEISREQLLMGADLFCVLANFGGENAFHIAKTRAVENLTSLVLCNRVGCESMPDMDARFLEKSTILMPQGKETVPLLRIRRNWMAARFFSLRRNPM